MGKYRKYKVTGKVTEYKNGEFRETWDAEDFVVAQHDWFAKDMFIDGCVNRYCDKMDISIDVDNIECEDIGPADVFISMRRDAYSKERLDTMAVGDLIAHLEQFDKDSKIYMADFTGMVNMYGGITEYGIGILNADE